MTTDTPAPESDAPIRDYKFVGLIALGVIWLVLMTRELPLLGLVPVLIGLAGLGARWRSAPVLVLIALAAVQIDLAGFRWGAWPVQERDPIADVILAAATLAYVATQYRIQGLTIHIFPPGPRHRKSRSGDDGVGHGPHRRSASLATAGEMQTLLMLAPAWAALGLLAWGLLPANWTYLFLYPRLWRVLVLAWGLGLAVLVGVGLFRYVGWRQMSTEEAALFMQDTWWRETRREQRRLNRWLAWARLRRKGPQ